MQLSFSDPVLQCYALAAVVLALKMILTAGATGTLRLIRKSYITEEDARFMRAEGSVPDPLTARLERIQRNDLENIPLFLILGLLFALSAPSLTAASWIFGLFTLSRLLYTPVYLAQLQPWRSIVFELGNFTHVAMIVMLIINLWFS